MKPLFQELPFPIDSHIHFYVEDLPHFIVPWHYHPAIEIMYTQVVRVLALSGIMWKDISRAMFV